MFQIYVQQSGKKLPFQTR
jgi:hypothetical protein